MALGPLFFVIIAFVPDRLLWAGLRKLATSRCKQCFRSRTPSLVTAIIFVRESCLCFALTSLIALKMTTDTKTFNKSLEIIQWSLALLTLFALVATAILQHYLGTISYKQAVTHGRQEGEGHSFDEEDSREEEEER